MTTTVQEFIKDKSPLETATLEDSIQIAVKKMKGHDFSQLPVVDSDDKPIGIVTSDSILHAMLNFHTNLEGIRIKHALLKKPQIFEQNIDLLDLFDEMSGNFALIVDEDGRLLQIITDFDTAEYFRQRAQDIILIENIENMLKEFILSAFGTDAKGEERLERSVQSMTNSSLALRQRFEKGLRNFIGVSSVKETVAFDPEMIDNIFSKHLDDKRPPATFEDLSLGHYISLFLYKDFWPQLQDVLELEKSAIENLLDNVRNTRNDLSHFREITPDQSYQLRDCYNLLIDHQEAINRTFAKDQDVEDEAIDATKETTLDDAVLSATGTLEEIKPTEDEPLPNESRYAPLAIWLQDQPAEKNLVKPTFAKIEEIIGGKLPASAYKNRSWWANDTVGHAQSIQWLDVGWRVASADVNKQVVRFARIKERQRAYIDFYSKLITMLREDPMFAHLETPRPDGVNWYWVKGFTVNGRHLGSATFSFGRRSIFRIEFYIDSGDREVNKALFDNLESQKDEIEAEFGHELLWQRLETRRASRISRIFNIRITSNEEKLASLREQAIPAMTKFISVMQPRVEKVAGEIL